LVEFAERLNIPVATTFMGKGTIGDHHPLSLGAIGLQVHDYVNAGFDQADVVIAVGYDFVEYSPRLWNPDRDKKIVHIDVSPAEVDAAYIVAVGVVGNIGQSLAEMARTAKPRQTAHAARLRQLLHDEREQYRDDRSFPLKPQRILSDLRGLLREEDILISDVGAHKVWVARMFPCYRPHTCIISNGFASMGIAVPGSVAAKLLYPDRRVVAVCGDGGFLMNSAELETAARLNAPIIVVVFNDQTYGLIKWKQLSHFGREAFVDFSNPDFVRYAESFGARGLRVQAADELVPILRQALQENTSVVIDCPVDFSENMKLTEKLGSLVGAN
jgi:acetolactate synthase-1/2/3 large subunit